MLLDQASGRLPVSEGTDNRPSWATEALDHCDELNTGSVDIAELEGRLDLKAQIGGCFTPSVGNVDLF